MLISSCCFCPLDVRVSLVSLFCSSSLKLESVAAQAGLCFYLVGNPDE